MSNSTTLAPPQPLPTQDSEAWWASLSAKELRMQRCDACRRWQFPCLERCRHCNGVLRLEVLSGWGTIHTFIVQHHGVGPGFEALRPYAIALVALDEDPSIRLPGRVLGDPKAVGIGGRVHARIEALPGGDFKVATFELSSSAGTSDVPTRTGMAPSA